VTGTQDSAGLPEELRFLKESVREFVQREIRPLEDQLPPDAPGLPPELLGPVQDKARRSGLWALKTPAEFGGAGLSVLAQVVVAEEAARCRSGAFFPAGGAFGGDPPSPLFDAPRELFERYGRPIVEGTMGRAFTAISESSGGSDPARAIRCRAERDGDSYVLNGEKMWTTHAGTADWGIVYARTGAADSREGISCFVVETNVPGLTKTPIGVMSSYSPYVVHFDDVRIPAENRIGEEGAGFRQAERFLIPARIGYAAGPIGIAQLALEMAIDWVRDRRAFGSALGDKQAIQWMIADSEIELRAARLLLHQAARNADLGHDVKVDAAASKVFGTETAFRVVDRCVQMFGALGLATELPLERWFRDLRVKRLGEGSSEIQRMIIARHLIGRTKN
jgi:acyl-CoA dehydrogenase